MVSLLLAIIYLSFISLGLPDSVLGSAWPLIHVDFGVPVSYMGIISMIIAGSTIVSTFFSGVASRKIGTGLTTAFSVALTAAALFGFSLSNSLMVTSIIAVPYGLGAGAVDASLNSYVAAHFSSRHMSWLHCFWGVGASISPYIMGACLTGGLGWRGGYTVISVVQVVLSAIIFSSIPIWKKHKAAMKTEDAPQEKRVGLFAALKIKGVVLVLIAFFAYCAIETTLGLWASTYLVKAKGISEETAATFASLFYLGITAGRFVCGFFSEKLGDRLLIRLGIGVLTLGGVMIISPFGNDVIALTGLVVAGVGCAPIYPSIIHSTPSSFGKENADVIIGIQMASAYIGSTFMPPLYGILSTHISPGLLPIWVFVFTALMLLMLEVTNRLIKTKNS